MQEIKVPNIGDFSGVEVIELHIKPGDIIEAEDSLISLETDKATMDIPAPHSGTVAEVRVKVGDKVSEGDLIVVLSGEAAAEAPVVAAEQQVPSDTASAPQSSEQLITVPNIGDFSGVEVIEVSISVGDTIEEEDGLLSLETDKATMDVPAPFGGKVTAVHVSVGDKVSEGDRIATVASESAGVEAVVAPASSPEVAEPAKAPAVTPPPHALSSYRDEPASQEAGVHAGPATRRLARELGIDLRKVQGTGPKGRLTTHDLHAFIKGAMQQPASSSAGLGFDPAPEIDFSQFGEVEVKPQSRIRKRSARNLHRNWVSIPHVTHFDEADITALESFRKDNKALAAEAGVKLTPLPFIMKALVTALRAFPRFNTSLSADGESIVQKYYYHIGIAVDTPNGLMVPVIRDVDAKSLLQLAKEVTTLSEKAKLGKLRAEDMMGSCMTISSLGSIGGVAFTPIVNAPDVAILGISKAAIKPRYENDAFVPALMLPLSLSYDHRVIDGAEAARFSAFLVETLSDVKKLLLT